MVKKMMVHTKLLMRNAISLLICAILIVISVWSAKVDYVKAEDNNTGGQVEFFISNSDGNTVVSVSKKDGEEISKGTTLTFRRYADRGDRVKTISGTMIVLDAIDNGKNYNII